MCFLFCVIRCCIIDVINLKFKKSKEIMNEVNCFRGLDGDGFYNVYDVIIRVWIGIMIGMGMIIKNVID